MRLSTVCVWRRIKVSPPAAGGPCCGWRCAQIPRLPARWRSGCHTECSPQSPSQRKSHALWTKQQTTHCLIIPAPWKAWECQDTSDKRQHTDKVVKSCGNPQDQRGFCLGRDLGCCGQENCSVREVFLLQSELGWDTRLAAGSHHRKLWQNRARGCSLWQQCSLLPILAHSPITQRLIFIHLFIV